jgi:hypothetical protein
MIQDRSFGDRFHNGKWQVSTGRWKLASRREGAFLPVAGKEITSAGLSMDASRLVVGNVAPLFQVNVAIQTSPEIKSVSFRFGFKAKM